MLSTLPEPWALPSTVSAAAAPGPCWQSWPPSPCSPAPGHTIVDQSDKRLGIHFCTLQNFNYLLQFHLWHIISVHDKISANCFSSISGTSFLYITKFQLSASVPSLAHRFFTLQNVNYLLQFQLSLAHHFGTLQNFNYLLQFHLGTSPQYLQEHACKCASWIIKTLFTTQFSVVF